MTPRSRTGKLMQGLWGRFGNKTPAQPPIEPNSYRPKATSTPFDLDESEFPSARVFDVDDEETNWDDTETLADEQNPNVYSQPIVPSAAPSASPKPPATRRSPAATRQTADLDDWDDALPAPTVRNSDRQQARRNPKIDRVATDEDMWAEDVPTATVPTSDSVDNSKRNLAAPIGGAVGLWSSMLGQLRRILPPPLRRLSDAILTAILVMLVTLSIWIVDGLFAPPLPAPVAVKPPTIDLSADKPKETTTASDRAQSEARETAPDISQDAGAANAQSTPTVAVTPAPSEPAPVSEIAPAESESTAVVPPTEPSESEAVPTQSAPPIARKVSPDREFIDAIAARIDELTSAYPDNIIAGLDVNVARSRAIVTLDSSWQTLSAEELQQLLDRMWQQAKVNHFNKLEVHNPQGKLIARSPVVGDRMVVLGS